MSYVVSNVTFRVNEHIEHRTVVHKVNFDISKLLPSTDMFEHTVAQVQPHWVKNKFHLRTAEEFMKGREYHIFKEPLSPDYSLKYMQVLTNRFKPKNLFETFLIKHNLLHKSLTEGVEVEFKSKRYEYSREFGQKLFESEHKRTMKLYDEPELYPYYQEHVDSGQGSCYTYHYKVIIQTIDKKPWIPPGVDKIVQTNILNVKDMDEFNDEYSPELNSTSGAYLF